MANVKKISKRVIAICGLVIGGIVIFSLFLFRESPIDPPFKEFFLDIGNGRIRVVSAGEKSQSVWVFVHGSPGSWSNFKALMKIISEKNRCIAYDRPGYGRSMKMGSFNSLESQARILLDVLESIKVKQNEPCRFILVGHSYGAPLVLKLAIEHPNLCQGLVLIGAAVDPDLEEWKWYNRWLEHPWIRFVMPGMFLASNDELKPLKKELIQLDLKSIVQPVLALHGQKDRLVPVENLKLLKQGIPYCQTTIFPEYGHFIPWEIPEKLAQSMEKWADLVPFRPLESCQPVGK